jgi:hypothetical protein
LSKRDFEKLLLEAVDEGLSSLGQSSKRAIYFHLEEGFKVKREEIPCKVEVFTEAIEKMFGVGADYLEVLIMKRLHEKIGGVLDSNEIATFTFAEYIEAVKRNLRRKNRAKGIADEIIQYEKLGVEV